ncbi:MAG: terpene cyclase/mutase family protein [Lentisphaerales bacterium]|nr:terpene cyclase/mutase family protein [Lentisphaerales bacterium]
MSECQDIEEEFYLEDPNAKRIIENSLLEIQAEYKRKRLFESLVGPCLSTVFHVALIAILAIAISDKYKHESPEIVIDALEVEDIQIEEPPAIEEPEEVASVDDPVITTVKVDNVETNDDALEDVDDEAPSTADDSTVDAISDVTVSPSAFASPSVLGGRSSAGRASAVSRFGGSKKGQDVLLKSLYWLQKVQNPDGSWGGQRSIKQGLTGLAILTYLAYGETPFSRAFGQTVRKGMDWLVKSDIDVESSHGYSHAIKTYALAEAYAMTGIEPLQNAMNKNLIVIIKGIQNGGSFNYHYEGPREDLSFAGWNYQALKAAYAAGCDHPGLLRAIEKSIKWLKKTAKTDNSGNGFPYSKVDGLIKGKGKASMRAIGVLCLQLLGEGKTPEIKDEIATISTKDFEKLSWENPPLESLYTWYYATQCMFQHGGEDWQKWNKKFQSVLVKNQNSEGYWDYPGKGHMRAFKGIKDERIYGTTLCALMLTVYYRYLPSAKGLSRPESAKKTIVEIDEGIDLLE